MKKCIIIEDQAPAQRVLKKYIEDVGILELIGVYTSAVEALPIVQTQKLDLIFLDIHLPTISGIDFLSSLKNPPMVIMTTAFPDYALQSFEYNVVDYLLKPFSFQRFVQAVAKFNSYSLPEKQIQTESTKTDESSVYIKSGHDLIRVRLLDILYVKSDTDYTEIITKHKKYLSQDSLKSWVDRLPESFCQIHKSYIVNLDQIHKVSGGYVYVSDEEALPIGRVFKEVFHQRLMKQG